MGTKDKIMELVSAPIAELGFELIDIKLARYRKESRLQLFIDGDNGVSIDDCVRISRLVGPIFDNSGLFKFGYGLEVSSPGLDRPLETARDFKRRVGETVEIYFNDKKQKSVRGELVGADERFIEIKIENDLNKFDLMDIRKGKIIV